MNTIQFTSNATLAKSNSTTYLLSPTEVVPANEPADADTCGLAFAVYPPNALTDDGERVVGTQLDVLEVAVGQVVGACTGAGEGGMGMGMGGTVSVEVPGGVGGVRIDVTVQRPV